MKFSKRYSHKTNKSPGPNKIYSKLLQDISREILSPLTMVFNMPLQHSIVPSDRNLASVTPVFKKRRPKITG